MSTQSHLLALAALHDSKAMLASHIRPAKPDGLAEAHRTVASLIRAHLTGEPVFRSDEPAESCSDQPGAGIS